MRREITGDITGIYFAEQVVGHFDFCRARLVPEFCHKKADDCSADCAHADDGSIRLGDNGVRDAQQ
jgi:hypothetical protein